MTARRWAEDLDGGVVAIRLDCRHDRDPTAHPLGIQRCQEAHPPQPPRRPHLRGGDRDTDRQPAALAHRVRDRQGHTCNSGPAGAAESKQAEGRVVQCSDAPPGASRATWVTCWVRFGAAQHLAERGAWPARRSSGCSGLASATSAVGLRAREVVLGHLVRWSLQRRERDTRQDAGTPGEDGRGRNGEGGGDESCGRHVNPAR